MWCLHPSSQAPQGRNPGPVILSCGILLLPWGRSLLESPPHFQTSFKPFPSLTETLQTQQVHFPEPRGAPHGDLGQQGLSLPLFRHVFCVPGRDVQLPAGPSLEQTVGTGSHPLCVSCGHKRKDAGRVVSDLQATEAS